MVPKKVVLYKTIYFLYTGPLQDRIFFFFGPSVGWLVGWLVSQLVGRSAGCLVGESVGQSVGWSIAW